VENLECQINKLTTLEEAYSALGEHLHQKLPRSIIVLIQLDEKRDLGYVNNIIGVKRYILNKVTNLLGINPIGRNFKNTPFGREHLYTAQKFIQFNGNLHKLSGGLVPEWIFKTVEKLVNVKDIFAIGLSSYDKAIGTVVIMPKGNESSLLKELEHAIGLFSIRMAEILDQYTSNMVGIATRNRFTKALIENISHEIRTPLNGVVGLMDAGLKLIAENETTRHLTNNIWKSSRELTYKIDYLLIIAELESDTAEFNFKIYDSLTIRDEIKTVAKNLNKEHAERKIHVHDNTNMSVLSWYKMDLHYFELTIKELLLNALKFSTNDVNVFITNKVFLNIEIIDTGIGMPTNISINQLQLFNKTRHNAINYTGMGIGYKIIDHIVTKHDWDIQIDTAENQGTKIKLGIREISKN